VNVAALSAGELDPRRRMMLAKRQAVVSAAVARLHG
jgi:hypothetical protein